MKQKLTHHQMAQTAAKFFEDGDVVNLGGGIPTLCSQVPLGDREITLHSENGVTGFGETIKSDDYLKAQIQFTEATGMYYQDKPGMAHMGLDTSLDLMRNGTLDITCLGAYQIAENGDIANWKLPGDISIGIGGAMDLAYGAKKVIALMEHVSKKGDLRILNECTYPLTAKSCVNLIVTDIAVIECTENGLVLKEHAPGWSVEEIRALTEPTLIIADNLSEIEL